MEGAAMADAPHEPRFSATQLAIAGLAAAVILIVAILVNLVLRYG
jgi:hypothetical protein